MKGIRETKASPKSDLLVCFPCHAHHLTLMAKPICSPGRPPDPNNKCHHLKKSSTTRSSGHASPLLWGKPESMGSEIAEPTSPKVTCAGKIKARPKQTTKTCRSWQSVMEEIDKIHNNDNGTKHWKKKKKSTPNWVHCISFKKEAVHLLACFRGMRFDMGCFGAFNGASIATMEEEEEEDDEYEDEKYRENQVGIEECETEASGSVFSDWVIVLQEKQSNVVQKEKEIEGARNNGSSEDIEAEEESNVPPPNALLLMRCSSAPVRSSLKEKNEEQGKEENENRGEGNKVKEKAKGKSLKSLIEENRKIENLLVMQYNSDYYKISSSRIAKDKGTWILGGLRDPLSRSESWNK